MPMKSPNGRSPRLTLKRKGVKNFEETKKTQGEPNREQIRLNQCGN
jgi:hypothetical protein